MEFRTIDKFVIFYIVVDALGKLAVIVKHFLN